MSLYQNLINAGLPIDSATEDGQVRWSFQMTDTQYRTYRDIVMQYIDPVSYNLIATIRTNQQSLKDEYINAITTLETIQNTTNPTNAQVISAVKYEAKVIEELIKVLKDLLT